MSKIVADLHLHSAYARATSKNLNFDTLSAWAKLKGINLLSSADFTHPIWFEETKKKLKDKGNGFLTYQGLDFMLGGEVSCIFSQGGKLRRVHLLLFAPSFASAEKINKKLSERGKLASDGRPILGMRAKDVLELVLAADKDAIVIPAHIWTPWFGVLGAFGGFDSLQACFEDLTPFIYGVETGLSSDPAMNWRVKELDKKAIVSFSDAHSAPKMGRELTIFDTEPSYLGILEALKKQKIEKTIEFFPEEGKYHLNGHRNCNFKETPAPSLERNGVCPVCRKGLTIGVMHRVNQIAEKERGEDFVANGRPGFKKLVPLGEVIAEALESTVSSKKVIDHYGKVLEKFGTEMQVLLETETKLLENHLPRLGEAVEKVRKEDIFIDPGFDGVYGIVKVWPSERKELPEVEQAVKEEVNKGQMNLF